MQESTVLGEGEAAELLAASHVDNLVFDELVVLCREVEELHLALLLGVSESNADR